MTISHNFSSSSSTPYDPTDALMQELSNPNLCASNVVAGVIAQVASLVSSKELKVRQQEAQNRAQVAQDQTTAVQAEVTSMQASGVMEAATSGASAGIEVVSFAKTVKDEKANSVKNKELEDKIKDAEQRMSPADARTGAARDDTAKANLERQELIRKQAEFKEKASRDHETNRALFAAGSKALDGISKIGAQMMNGATKAAQNSAELLADSQKAIAEAEKTAGDAAQQAIQILGAAGDMAKAAAGR